MTEPQARPSGWHADLDARRYRYWDGSSWSFSASAKDLDAYRQRAQVLAGVDFQAPVHSELPPEAQPERRRGRVVLLGVVAVAAIVLVTVLLAL